jgi:hypothetical protein
MYSKVTPIDLLDLSDSSDLSDNVPEQITKFIRKPMPNPPNQSGMSHNNPNKFNPNVNIPPPPDFYHQDLYDQQNKLPATLYCLDVHSHIQSCPICSRFFKQDNSLYIIVIIVLSIICILALKKVLNV